MAIRLGTTVKVTDWTPPDAPNTELSLDGAQSLLKHCVCGTAEERLLIVTEKDGAGYYDNQAAKLTADTARSMGMFVYETQAPLSIDCEKEMSLFLTTLRGFDHIIFFARVGDQLRFSINEDLPPATMCYALGAESLNSAFGTACHSGLIEVRDAINATFASAKHIQVSCPKGTNYSGFIEPQEQALPDVKVKRFPMLIPKPVPANDFEGTIALSRFLMGTGSRHYDPYYLPLDNDVLVEVKNNRIVNFNGDHKTVAKVKKHYKHVANLFNIDPWYVHSWHAGMHPACTFNTDAYSDILRWAGSAFGNPRILHFHTCGQFAPGEISWNIIDPTITLDGVKVWEDGLLHPERLQQGKAILQKHPKLHKLYSEPQRNIGIQ